MLTPREDVVLTATQRAERRSRRKSELEDEPPLALSIGTTSNQDSPLMQHFVPILGLDLWEHSYYLKHQNRRDEYINNCKLRCIHNAHCA